MTDLLRLDGLSKSYGAIRVADNQCLALAEGEALGVIGPNGAGKTSLFNLITGTVAPDAGRIRFGGADITALSAARRCRAGIARSFQIPQPFAGMSVFENALTAATQSTGLPRREAEALCLDVLERTGLLPRANTLAGHLPLLERKRLELTRALCCRPRLLLLDEIAGGLTEAECTALVATISDLRATGITIVWIEHVVHALIAVVDRLVVIDFGRIIADGHPATIMQSQQVRDIYLGIDADG